MSVLRLSFTCQTNFESFFRLSWLWKYGGLYIDSDFLALHSFFNLNNSFISLQSLSPESGFTNAIMKLTRHHPLLMDWLGKMKEEYDNTNKEIWGDLLTTSVVLDYCSEEMLVEGGREVGRRDDLSVLVDVSCQGNLNVIDHSVMFPVGKRDWKRVFISSNKDAKVVSRFRPSDKSICQYFLRRL